MQRIWRIGIVLLFALTLAGCSDVNKSDSSPAGFSEARDMAMRYLEAVHPELIWPASYKWTAEDVTSGRLGATVWRFTEQSGIAVLVSLPVVPNPLYDVEVAYDGFTWAGRVDAEGKVVEEQPTPAPPLTIESARDAAVAQFSSLHAGLLKPAEWTVAEVSGGLVGASAFGFLGGGWTVDVQAPVVPRPEYAVRVTHESGARWACKVLEDGSIGQDEGTSFLADDTRLTRTLEAVLADPRAWEDRIVRVVGYYEGWDLFGSAGSGPALTKSDWVIRDSGGAIYVGGGEPIKALDIAPSEKVEGVLLRLYAEVRVTDQGQPYLWVVRGARIGPIGEAWLEYERSGGIAGFQDLLTVYPDGHAVLNRRGEETSLQVTAEQMAALNSSFAVANFLSLSETYLPADTCCDRFSYTIHYRDTASGRVHSVMAMDGSAPPELMALLETLNRLVNQPM
jgi:hypothetical protein